MNSLARPGDDDARLRRVELARHGRGDLLRRHGRDAGHVLL
jgi:hypothetical protein